MTSADQKPYMVPKYPPYKARRSKGSQSTTRPFQGYSCSFSWPNTTTMWNYPGNFTLSMGSLYFTPNKEGYISGQSKHAASEGKPKLYMD